MIIDTHLHVWSDDISSYPFADGRTSIEAGSVELLNETMAEAGVDKAVIVQPINYLYDNRYVADCLRRFPGKFEAIGLVDRNAYDAPDQLERLVVEDGFSGLRIHLARPDDPSEWAAPEQNATWQRAEELGSLFIVFGSASHLPAVEPIIRRFPSVPVILDHIGGAPIDEDEPYPLLNNVLRMAECPNVYVKFTPQADQSSLPYPHEDSFQTYRRIYDVFGPERLMWGTNFPLVFQKIGYLPALELFRTHLDFLTDEDREWLFSKTALKLWKFDD
jgi:L-fuconolactonase